MKAKAIAISSSTMVGCPRPTYPTPAKGGNCFSVRMEDGDERYVANFRLENLEELIRRGIVTWPIDVCLAPGNSVAIIDDRVPLEWGTHEACPICYRGPVAQLD